MGEQDIRIYFGNNLTNLYELGWISTDLNQLIEFSKLVESGELEQAEKYFGENARPFNRYVALNRKLEKRPEIVDVKGGSIELVISGVSLLASIIMPLVQIAVDRYFKANGEEVTFELSPKDQNLKEIMSAYEEGYFGQGRDGLTYLVSLLQQRNYNVNVIANNIYLIDHVVDKYAQRIIKTIKSGR
ncbi:MAG: hypothetical protein V9G21_07820 [Methylotenera sp.]|nr:hypothetical protein [Methylotenera sp.]HPM49569.1 hypothetical protein [Methylotenera sp.]